MGRGIAFVDLITFLSRRKYKKVKNSHIGMDIECLIRELVYTDKSACINCELKLNGETRCMGIIVENMLEGLK